MNFKGVNNMQKYHEIGEIKFNEKEMTIIIDGRLHNIPLNSLSKKLQNATIDSLCHYELSPSGYGIYWPDLDEDISIDGMLGIKHNPIENTKAA
jgi:hypothetical protein